MQDKTVNLNLDQAAPPAIIHVTQGDTAWRWHFPVWLDGLRWSIPTGAQAILKGLKPDGHVFAYTGSIANNEVVVDCRLQMTICAGPVGCTLIIMDTAGKRLHVARIALLVAADPEATFDVASDSALPAYAEVLGNIGDLLELAASLPDDLPAYMTQAAENWLDDHIDPSTGYVLDDTLTLSNAAAPADKVGSLKNASFIYRGTLTGDPTSAVVSVGVYSGRKTASTTGYPDDMTTGNYCWIFYFRVASNARYFLLIEAINSGKGKSWLYLNSTYNRIPYSTELTALENSAWVYRGSIGDGDPTTATVKIGTYTGHKITGSTGYPDDMVNNHYCFILYQVIGTASRAFTLFDNNNGIEWIYCNGEYHRVSQNTFLNGKKWACIGDSLTYPGTLRASSKYYDYIVGRTGITFINLGKSGTGYVNEGNGQGNFISRVPDIPNDCDVVTIFGSGNDLNLLPIGTAEDTTNTTLMGNVYLTIQAIFTQKPDVLLGIIAPTPWMQYPPYQDNKMLTFTTELEKLCKKYSIPFLDLYHESNLRPWDSTFRQNYYSKDDGNGTHPDENGNMRFAPMIQKFLEKIVLAPLS